MRALIRTQLQPYTWLLIDFRLFHALPSSLPEWPPAHITWALTLSGAVLQTGEETLLFTCLNSFDNDSILNPRSQFSESCFLWALNNKHGPTLSCSPLLPKTYQLIWGLEREFLVRVCLVCPRGVKVTSGLCLWPDSLGTAAATSRSWVGAGAGPGQWAVACTAFPRRWELRLCRPDSQHMVFAKETVPFPKCSLNRLYFSDHFYLKGGLTFTTAQKWPGELLTWGPLKNKCW